MKKLVLKQLLLIVICFSMTMVLKSQSTATTFAELQSQFAAASASGVPSTINIGSEITIDADFSMVSTGDTVTLNFVPNRILVSSGTLIIGDKVKITSTVANAVTVLVGGTVIVNDGCNITSTATAPLNVAGGEAIVNGGKISTSNFPAASAGSTLGSGGTLTVNGGLLYTSNTGTFTRGIVVDYNGTCIVNGGVIHANPSVSGRAISINATNAGGKLYINGGTIAATGVSGRAIQLDNNNASALITGSPTISGGLEAIMLQKFGVAVVSGTPSITGRIGTNATGAKLYDARGLSLIEATPGTGYYTATQSVTVTGGSGTVYKYVNTYDQGAATTVSTSLVYTADGSAPVAASTAYSSPVEMTIPAVLKVAPLIDGTVIGSPVTYNYWATGTPQTSAPTPPIYASPKVTSIFSDAFSNVAGTNFNPGWGQSGSITTVQVADNNTLKMANLNYQGIQFGSTVNALPMTHLHLDVFTSDETSLQIFCISASTGEKMVQLTPLTLNEWNSYDISLTNFTSQGLGISDLIQFKFVGSGGKTSYLDNIYFYNNDPTPDAEAPTGFTASAGLIASDAIELLLNGTDNSGAVYYEITYGSTTLITSGISGVQKSYQVTSLDGSTEYNFSIACKDATGNEAANNPIVVTATTLTALPGAPTPTHDPAKVMSIFSDTYTSIAPTANYNPNWGQATVQSVVQLSGNSTIKYANLNYQGLDLNAEYDVSSMNKLHVHVYPIDETAFQITPISPGKENLVTLTPLTLNEWNTFEIVLSEFTGVDFTKVYQFKFVGAGSKTSYVDNLYFFNDEISGISETHNAVRFYPTSVINTLNISAGSEISTISVRNLIGQTVKAMTVNKHHQQVDLGNFPTGNYLVSVVLNSGEILTQKIIKL